MSHEEVGEAAVGKELHAAMQASLVTERLDNIRRAQEVEKTGQELVDKKEECIRLHTENHHLRALVARLDAENNRLRREARTVPRKAAMAHRGAAMAHRGGAMAQRKGAMALHTNSL
jgi:predicted RNase H-like nuclease (RuvC/YqgF family)